MPHAISNTAARRARRALALLVRRPQDVFRFVYRYAYRKLSDLPYEKALGISTSKFITSFQDSERQIHRYEPVPYTTLRDIARHMDRRAVSALRFVDIGCGLGRPLYFFSTRFQQLLGFELAEPLVLTARRQLEDIKRKKSGFGNIEFIMADATSAVPLDKEMVVFLYNPFGPELMAQLCRHLCASRAGMHVYYANPAYPEPFSLIADSSEDIPGFIPARYFYIRPAAITPAADPA